MTSLYEDALLANQGLQDRSQFSRELLTRVRAAVMARTHCKSPSICIFAAGSLARHETGKISDLDVFLIADRSSRPKGERSLSKLAEISTLSELIQVNDELSLPAFSGDGEYFKVQEMSELIEETGTATDDSENFFTTRLLLLLESKCLANDTLYDEAVRRIVEMYFRDGKGKRNFQPLFLLNDILRYWRTLCLNYERTRHEPGKPWWKKNLNLKFPRKLSVFSTVLCIIATHPDGKEAFRQSISKTPLERLAFALDTIGDRKYVHDFVAFLDNYEDFLAAKSHAELEPTEPSPIRMYSEKAQQFDDLLHSIFGSDNLDQKLVRFVSI